MTPGERSHEPRAKKCWKHGASPVIGLTGGVASGKSSVASLLAERGCALIDADSVGHEVLDRPGVVQKLVEHFGPGVVAEGGLSSARRPQVDRKALGAIVFVDPEARHVLEAIVHPLMRVRFALAIEQELGPGRPVVLDAAILLEKGWDDLCDLVAFVDAPRSERLHRAAASRGWSDEDFAARERAQWSCEEKRRRADFVIRNDSAPDSLLCEVERLVATLTRPAEPASGAQRLQGNSADQPSGGRHFKEGTGSGAWQNPCPVS
jgi:dephospho-CoA kinase